MYRAMAVTLLALVLVGMGGPVRSAAATQAEGTPLHVTAPQAVVPGAQTAWRLRIREAAVVRTDVVHLGDIADPLGNISQEEWQRLAARPLWPAPETPGKPLQINRLRLGEALRQTLGDIADSCLLPNSLAVQRDGAVLLEEDLRNLVVRTLTPQINLLGGHGELTDFRLPAYAFTAHDGQSVALEEGSVSPGRISLRFAVREMDGSVVRRFSGSVFLNLWMDVPCALRPLERGEAVTPEIITFMSANLAYQKGTVWDGRGGPWQVVRSIGASQPIMTSDLAPLSAIHRGDRVTLVYSRGNVRMAVPVEALEEGSPGDTIAVRNLDTRKQVYATVQDADTVVIR